MESYWKVLDSDNDIEEIIRTYSVKRNFSWHKK